VWIHGDLHPANLVVRDGALVGVIDWGDIAAGDPAADLQVAWTWFGPDGAAALLRALDVDDATAARARANALAHGLACLAFSADNPRMAAVGTATLRRVLEGP
jgi:aminoglycoside phosphotransferase (APT) family kinase protein